MKISELIGKKIADIKDKIESFDSNELLISNGIIKLESGKTFEIPYRNSETLFLVENPKIGYTSIFNEDGFFKKLFSKRKYDKEIASRNKKAMKGKIITVIYQFKKEGVNNLAGKMIIELESEYMIGEVEASPFGTGAAGLYIFTSKEELEKEHGEKLTKIKN